MTKQSCRDCKHLETDGMFGIFCGVGGDNTKYDCPKYEKRTSKRFTINNDMDFDDKFETYELNCIVDNKNKTFYFIADSLENVQLFIKRLNELHKKNERLKEKIQRERNSFRKTQERWSKEAEIKIKELSEENEQLQKSLSVSVEKNKKLQTILDKLGYIYW